MTNRFSDPLLARIREQEKIEMAFREKMIHDRLIALGWTPPNTPVDMILHCPACHRQHVDAADSEDVGRQKHEQGECIWENPPHRSHLCAQCGHIWRPADVFTNGVEKIQTHGKNDS